MRVLRLPTRAVRDAHAALAAPSSAPLARALAASIVALAIERGETLVPGTLALLSLLVLDGQMGDGTRLRLSRALSSAGERGSLTLKTTEPSRRHT